MNQPLSHARVDGFRIEGLGFKFLGFRVIGLLDSQVLPAVGGAGGLVLRQPEVAVLRLRTWF